MGLRVLVAGAGAVGSVIGGLLAAAGHNVTLLGRRIHLAAIASDGLALEGLWGERLVRVLTVATAVEELEGPFDAVILTVKSYDTAAVMSAMKGLVAADGCVIALQNGLGNVEQVAAAVGPARAVGGRVIFGAAIPRAGVVRVTVFADPIALGAAIAGTPAAERHARQPGVITIPREARL